MLDTGPLGMIAHPRPNPEITQWLRDLLSCSATIIIPEIADYELRRELILNGLQPSLDRLDELKQSMRYCPISTDTMLQAAEFWAQCRRQGRPTGDPKELDGDAILAAQAKIADAVIATENVGHLSLFVEARDWQEID